MGALEGEGVGFVAAGGELFGGEGPEAELGGLAVEVVFAEVLGGCVAGHVGGGGRCFSMVKGEGVGKVWGACFGMIDEELLSFMCESV